MKLKQSFKRKDGERRRICYARVSSAHQKEDLERQVEDLRRRYPNHEIVRDIGSGLNWNRKGFEKMMKDVMDAKVEEIVCTHKDRMCRFGFELVEMILHKFGVPLIIMNATTKSHDYQQELAEDQLAVGNVFVAKNNGKRSSDNRKRRREQTQQTENKRTKFPNKPMQ